MASEKLIVIGASGTGTDVVELAEQIAESGGHEYTPVGYLDDAESKQGTEVHGLPILGKIEDASKKKFRNHVFVSSLGGLSTYARKSEILQQADLSPESFVNLIHPTAVISRTANLGHDVVVFPFVTIRNNTNVGDHVVFMSHVSVGHDVNIEGHNFIAAGTRIGGGATVGENIFVGLSSTIRNGITLGDGVLVGMGSAVTKDVPSGTRVMGVPAKPFLTRS